MRNRNVHLEHLTCIFAILLLPVVALADVAITTDTATDEVVAEYVEGDTEFVTFYVNGETGRAIYGVDFELSTEDNNVVIRSIEFNPAFSKVMGVEGTVFPTSAFKTVRTQPLDTIDRSLGANGEQVPFATAEIEILNGVAFESALKVKARGSLLGKDAKKTVVLDEDTSASEGDTGVNELLIINESLATSYNAETAPWTTEESTVSIEVRKPGISTAESTLTAGETYELHYVAGVNQVTGCVVFSVVTDAAHGLTSLTKPAAGEWSGQTMFESQFVNPDAQLPDAFGFSTGYYRADSAFLNMPLAPGQSEEAGGTGHLLDFVPKAAGDLGFEFHMFHDDIENQHGVEMSAQLMLDVQAPPGS